MRRRKRIEERGLYREQKSLIKVGKGSSFLLGKVK
jgi:hypothetical protein